MLCAPERVRKLLPVNHQKIVPSNCATLDPLANCRPYPRRLRLGLRRERALPLLLVRWGCDSLFSFAPTCCDPSNSCCVAPELVGCSGLSKSCSLSLVQPTHANKELLHVRHASTSSALSALTTAHRCRLHDQFTQHQSLYRVFATTGECSQLKCCGSDEMPFSGTRIERKQLVMKYAL